jgi:hypothetical protein
MADNVAISPGAGVTIATDDVGGVQYQRVKLDFGGDGVAVPLITAIDSAVGATDPVIGAGHKRVDTLAALTPAASDWAPAQIDAQGALWARRPAFLVVSATPTLDTAIYASGDSLHTAVISFASAVRLSGGAGRVRKVLVIDKDLQSAAGELWLFSATVTPAAANAAHSISDGDAALCVGVIPFGTYYASALNSISIANVEVAINCAATTLFGILVTRGTPTYTAAGLTVALHIEPD